MKPKDWLKETVIVYYSQRHSESPQAFVYISFGFNISKMVCKHRSCHIGFVKILTWVSEEV